MRGKQIKRIKKAFKTALLAQNLIADSSTKMVIRNKKYSWTKTTFELYNEERRLLNLFKKEKYNDRN